MIIYNTRTQRQLEKVIRIRWRRLRWKSGPRVATFSWKLLCSGPAAFVPSISASSDLSSDTRLHTPDWISRLLFQEWPSTYKSYWKWSHCHTVPDTVQTPYRLSAEVCLWQCLRTETKMKWVRKRKCVLVCRRLHKADKKRGSIQDIF